MSAPNLPPGLHPGIAMEDYLALDAASNSRLRELAKSPAHLKASMGAAPTNTEAQRVGSAVHTAVLEPDRFARRYVVAEQCVALLSSGQNKGKRCSHEGVWKLRDGGWLCGVHVRSNQEVLDPADTVVITEGMRAQCLGIAESIYAHPYASEIIRAAVCEQTGVWVDPGTGVTCKLRGDVIRPELRMLADLKTCEDARQHAFERSIFNYGYYRQQAFYGLGLAELGQPIADHVLIAVEKRPPFGVKVYRLRDDVMKAGRDEVRSLLTMYGWCVNNNDWPCYDADPVDIGLPRWAWHQINDMEEAA